MQTQKKYKRFCHRFHTPESPGVNEQKSTLSSTPKRNKTHVPFDLCLNFSGICCVCCPVAAIAVEIKLIASTLFGYVSKNFFEFIFGCEKKAPATLFDWYSTLFICVVELVWKSNQF